MALDEAPWDSPKWKERTDSEWTGGCRWLQSWWREQQGHRAGEFSQTNDRPVASMLPLGTEPERNFYGANVVRAMDERILNGAEFPLAALDKMFRDLLSAQTACANLFGEFSQQPSVLLPWLTTIDPEASSVDEIQLAWAPKKKLVVGGGAGFDAFVDYRADDRRRFVAIHCVYAQELADAKVAVRPTHVEFTETSGAWRAGASRRLDRPNLRPLWLDAMAVQSLREKDRYDAGRVVVMAVASNAEARTATDLVRSELLDADATLVWSPMEVFVKALEVGRADWAVWIRTRYLDFTPVESLLDAKDPRRSKPTRGKKRQADTPGLKELAKIGPRVTGDNGVVAALVADIASGKVDPGVAAALDDRAREIAADLKAFRDAVSGL